MTSSLNSYLRHKTPMSLGLPSWVSMSTPVNVKAPSFPLGAMPRSRAPQGPRACVRFCRRWKENPASWMIRPRARSHPSHTPSTSRVQISPALLQGSENSLRWSLSETALHIRHVPGKISEPGVSALIRVAPPLQESPRFPPSATPNSAWFSTRCHLMLLPRGERRYR